MSDLDELGTVIDLYKRKFKTHPITYGEKLENKGDKVLTLPCDVGSQMSLDYIIQIIPELNKVRRYSGIEKFHIKKTERRSLNNTSLKIDYDSAKLEKFHIKQKPYTQLSDHYGLSVELSLEYL